MYDGNTCITTESITEYTRDAEEHVTIATRPLAIQKNGTWYTYGLDLTKNECEVFGTTGYIGTAYTYSPYGQVTATGNVTQPIQWSSEFHDEELGLVYYNYRYYNSGDGRWNQNDIFFDIYLNTYIYNKNDTIYNIDYIGLYNPSHLKLNNLNYNSAFQRKVALGWMPRFSSSIMPEKKEINLSIYAYNSKNKEIASKIQASLLFYSKEVTSIADFEKIVKIKQDECIKELIIYAHGSYNRKTDVASMNIGGIPYIESNIASEISTMLGKLCYCKNCVIELIVCEIGNSIYLKDRLKKYTGCSLILYETSVNMFGLSSDKFLK